MLDEFDDMLQVTCDQNPNSLVSWYNKKTKKLVSFELFYANPDAMNDHVRVTRKKVDKFFAKAKESLQGFNAILAETINSISLYASEELALGATDFLKLIFKIRKLCSYFTDLKDVKPQEEEKKEDTPPESFDWLFCNFNGDIPH
jgi:hypothetical protein